MDQENITSGYYGPSKMWPGLGRATQKAWPTGQISGRALARPSPMNDSTKNSTQYEVNESTEDKTDDEEENDGEFNWSDIDFEEM